MRQRDVTGYPALLQELSDMDAAVFALTERAKAEGVLQESIDEMVSLLDNIWNTVKRSL